MSCSVREFVSQGVFTFILDVESNLKRHEFFRIFKVKL